MRCIKIVSVSFIFALAAGCSRTSPVPHNLSVEDIIDKIHCELHHAVWNPQHLPRNALLQARANLPKAPWWTGWKAGILLKLKRARDAGVEGSGSISVPIHRGTFTLGYLAGINKKATSSTTFKFDVYMDDLAPVTSSANPRKSTYQFNPNRCYDLESIQNGRKRLLAGNLGLTDWLQRASGAYRKTGTTPTGQSYFVEFVVTHNGSTTPGVNITNPTGENFVINTKISGKNVKTHDLTVTLAKVQFVKADEQLEVLKEVRDILKLQRDFTDEEIKQIEEEISNRTGLGLATTQEEERKRILEGRLKRLNQAIRDSGTVRPVIIEDDSNLRQQQFLDVLDRVNPVN